MKKLVNEKLGRMLAVRRLTIAELARMIYAGPCALSLVMNGRRVGSQTWSKLAQVLSKQEYDCAREFAAENLAAEWMRANDGELKTEDAPVQQMEVARFILEQKNKKGNDTMRLPKTVAELLEWRERQNKTLAETARST